MSKFEVGDTVWCLVYGKGIVASIREDESEHPVRVEFPDMGLRSVYYTVDGKYDYNGKRTLFFSEPEVEALTSKPFKSKLIGRRVALVKADGTSKLGIVTAEGDKHITISTLESKGLAIYVKAALTAIYEFNDTNYI